MSHPELNEKNRIGKPGFASWKVKPLSEIQSDQDE